jgi:hypothetical protein
MLVLRIRAWGDTYGRFHEVVACLISWLSAKSPDWRRFLKLRASVHSIRTYFECEFFEIHTKVIFFPRVKYNSQVFLFWRKTLALGKIYFKITMKVPPQSPILGQCP